MPSMGRTAPQLDGVSGVRPCRVLSSAFRSGGVTKEQESSGMLVSPSLQLYFESLLKPRKEWSVATAPFPNPPATPDHTSHLEQVGQVQNLLAPGGWRCSSESTVPPGCEKTDQEPLLMETWAPTLTGGQPPAEQQGGHWPGAEGRPRCWPPQTPSLNLALRAVQRGGSKNWGCDRYLRPVLISGGSAWYLEESKWTFSCLYGMASPSLFKL